MEAQLKEKQAMALVSGLQADIEALQAQVRSCYFICDTRRTRVGNSRVILLRESEPINTRHPPPRKCRDTKWPNVWSNDYGTHGVVTPFPLHMFTVEGRDSPECPLAREGAS